MSASNDTSPRRARLVEALVADLSPVRPLRLGVGYALALVLQFGFVAVAGALFGVDGATVARLFQGPFAVVLSLLILSSVLAALVALRLSVPGRYVPTAVKVSLAAAPLVLSVSAFIAAPVAGGWSEFSVHTGANLTCFNHTVMIAAPAWVLSVLVLTWLAPIHPVAVGLFASLTALFQAAIVVQLACPLSSGYHLALIHYLPLLVVGGLGAVVSGFVLRISAGSTGSTPDGAGA